MALNINGTTGISGVDASVSAPALAGTDSNTGISFPSADTIKFSTGGVERMSITNSGVSGGGKILQVVQSYKTDTFSASITYNDETGDITGLTPSITPSNASNKILVMWDVMTGNSASSRIGLKLYKASSVLTASLGDASGSSSRVTAYGSTTHNDRMWGLSGKYLDTAGGTSAITYSVRLRIGNSSSNTVYVNRPGTLYDNSGGMVAASSLVLMEIAA